MRLLNFVKYSFIFFCLSMSSVAVAQEGAPAAANSEAEFTNWLNSNAETAPPKLPGAATTQVTTTSTATAPPPPTPPTTTRGSTAPIPPPSPVTRAAPPTTAPPPTTAAPATTEVKITTPPPFLTNTVAMPPPILVRPTRVRTTTQITRPVLRRRTMIPVHMPEVCNDPTVLSPPISYSQSQKIMLQSAPATPKADAESQEAFKIMMKQNMPLVPRQVVQLRQLIDKSQRAASIPPNIPPKPVSSTIMINLAPGATPPAIRLAQNYVSSLVFVDSTGTPWPIAAYDIGDPKATTIQWDGKSNILLIQAVSPYSAGNLVIRLVGLPTPISLELVSGQRVVDYRTDIHVPGIGPNSTDLPIGIGLPDSANQLLLGVLDGVAPPGSRLLRIAGGGSDCQAWLLGDKMFLRTRFTVLSPGWVGKMSSPDGMYAYEMQRTSSVLISLYGNPVELKIEGF